MNFLRETKLILKAHGYTIEDISWVGCDEFRIPVEKFVECADTMYDNDFGGQEVAKDLVVVLKDGSWLERAVVLGAEWWAFKAMKKEPTVTYTGKVALTARQARGFKTGSTLAELCELAEMGA